MRVPQGWRTTWGKPDRGPALARAGVPPPGRPRRPPGPGQPWRVRAFPRASGRESAEARPALARAGVPSCTHWPSPGSGASPGACGRSPDAGTGTGNPQTRGGIFRFVPPTATKNRASPRARGASEASRGALRLPRESPRHAGGIISPSCSPRPDWGILRARPWARVADTVRRLPTPRGGRRHREGDITRAHVNNARRCRYPMQIVDNARRRQPVPAPRRWPSSAPRARAAPTGGHDACGRARRASRPPVALSPGAGRTPPRPPPTRPGEEPRRRLRCARGRSRRPRRTARKRR